MRRTLIAALSVVALSACKPDPEPPACTHPVHCPAPGNGNGHG